MVPRAGYSDLGPVPKSCVACGLWKGEEEEGKREGDRSEESEG